MNFPTRKKTYFKVQVHSAVFLHENVGPRQRGRRPQTALPAEYDVTSDQVAAEGEQCEWHEEQGDRFRVCFCLLFRKTLKTFYKVCFRLAANKLCRALFGLLILN